MSRGGHTARRAESDAAMGERIQVIGNSGSGKSTLATRLAEALDAAFVELDALNWLPGWIGLNQTDPDEFERRIRAATEGKRWVVAGSYERFSRRIVWPRLDTVVWLVWCRRSPRATESVEAPSTARRSDEE